MIAMRMKGRILGVFLLTVICVGAAYAVTVNSLTIGVIPFLDEIGGPATVSIVDATYAVGETVAWHYHPGEAYVIVKSGSITDVEACGGSQTFTAGQAFHEEAGHIHRAIPSSTEPTNIAFISVVPQGQPRTINVAEPVCIGPPASIAACQNDGWRGFTVPRVFKNQGDCVSWVATGR